MNKAPDAFRTISEVADELDLPQHVLRFWESRFPHIKPLKRGGGRRYYRPDDIDLLRGIRRLLYADGYTIRGVQRILREQGVRTVQLVGQGEEVPSLTTPTRDGDDDGRNGNNGLAEVNFLDSPDLGARDLGARDLGARDSAGRDLAGRDVAGRELAAPDGAEDRGDGPDAAPVRPQNGPVLEANIAVIHPVGATPVARQEPVRVDQARAAAAPVTTASVAVTRAAVAPAGVKPVGVPPAGVRPDGVTPAAVAKPPPPHMAARDLDRLKQALAELEACRRLLDKAHEGGR